MLGQKPFNFDYDGPMVSVSNSMALELVSKFGTDNAWLAFLKVRGVDEQKQEEEIKVAALNLFRDRLQKVQKAVEKLKERGSGTKDELDEFMGKQFDSFLEPNSIALKLDDVRDDVVDTMLDNEADELSASTTTSPPLIGSSKLVIADDEAEVEHPNEGDLPSEEGPTSTTNGGNKSQHLIETNSKKDQKTDLSAEKNVKGSTVGDSAKLLRHQETIDDAVSSVMSKIKSNEIFGADLIASSANKPASRHQKKGSAQLKQSGAQQPEFSGSGRVQGQQVVYIGGKQHQESRKQEMYQTAASGPFGYHQQNLAPGQVTILSNFNDIIRATSTSHHQQTGAVSQPHVGGPPAKIVNISGGHHGQLDQHIFHSPQHQHATTIQMPIQFQEQQTIPITLPLQGNDALQGIGGGFATISVQALLQSLQQQQQIAVSKGLNSQQQQQHLVQLEPDSSSQDNTNISLSQNKASVISPPIMGAKKPTRKRPAPKSANKKVGQQIETTSIHQPAVQQAPAMSLQQSAKPGKTKLTDNDYKVKQQSSGQSNQQIASQITTASLLITSPKKTQKGGAEVNTLSHASSSNLTSLKSTKKSAKRAKLDPAATTKDELLLPADDKNRPITSAGIASHEETKIKSNIDKKHQSLATAAASERIEDLEGQIRKLQRQLTAEQNKSLATKKRLDKIQSEHTRALDSIQLLQIDLACQKTDTNNLIAENISLKAELQQLRNKEATSKSKLLQKEHQDSSFSHEEVSPKKGRPSKKKSAKITKDLGQQQEIFNTSSTSTTNAESLNFDPPISLSDLGRRQSKRICVARSRFPFIPS